MKKWGLLEFIGAILLVIGACVAVVHFVRVENREARSGVGFVVMEPGSDPFPIPAPGGHECSIRSDLEGCAVIHCWSLSDVRGKTIARTCRGAIARVK